MQQYTPIAWFRRHCTDISKHPLLNTSEVLAHKPNILSIISRSAMNILDLLQKYK